jgi:hypothetical protein
MAHPEVPADAEQKNLGLDVTPFEWVEVFMKAVPLGSQNTVEFTSSLPFSQEHCACLSCADYMGHPFAKFGVFANGCPM